MIVSHSISTKTTHLNGDLARLSRGNAGQNLRARMEGETALRSLNRIFKNQAVYSRRQKSKARTTLRQFMIPISSTTHWNSTI